MLFHRSEELNSCWINGVRKCTSLRLTNLSTNTPWNLLLLEVLVELFNTQDSKSHQQVSLVNHGLLLPVSHHPVVLKLRSLMQQLILLNLLQIRRIHLKPWKQTLNVAAQAILYLIVRFGLTMVGNSIPLTGALILIGKLTFKTKLAVLTQSISRVLENTHGQVLPLCSQPSQPSTPPRPWPSERKLRINDWFGHQILKD